MILKFTHTIYMVEILCGSWCSPAEFVIFKLKEMGKIEQNDLNDILKEFDALDIDNSGTLSSRDLNLAQIVRWNMFVLQVHIFSHTTMTLIYSSIKLLYWFYNVTIANNNVIFS